MEIPTQERAAAVSAVSGETAADRRRGVLLVRGWAAVLVVYCLTSIFGDLSYRSGSVLNDVAWTVSAALASLSSWRAARAVAGRDRHVWFAFFAACGAWTLGQCVWDYYEIFLADDVPFPSFADVGYLAFGPLMIVGLMILRSTQAERRLTWLRVANLGLILCSLAMVLVITLTQPFAQAARDLTGALIVVGENTTVAIAFVIAVYLLWSYRWGERLIPLSLITLALGMQTIAGVLYTRELVSAEYGGLSSFNFMWVVAFALHQWAAEVQVRRRRAAFGNTGQPVDHRQEWVELLVPSLLVLCIAISSFSLADEIRVGTIHFGAIALGVFALILGIRESWSYAQGQRLRGLLEVSRNELTQERQKLQALAAERNEQERAIEMTARAGGVGLWHWNIRTNEVRLSAEWKRQLGYRDDEMPSLFDEWRTRLHPEDRETVTAALAAYLESPAGEYSSEQRLLHRDGTYRWVLTRGTMLFDDAGRKSEMLGSQVDITGFKKLEASLRDSETRYRELVDALESRVAERTEALSDAYRESQNFAYVVAHDLKAPLRAINGYNALLLDSAQDRLTEQELELVARARYGSLRMASLIDGLLDYSRVEHREQRIVALDCNDCLQEVLSTMSGAIEASEAKIDVHLDHAPVLADREGLGIVLRNLIDNALKFASPDRALHVVVESKLEAEAYVLRVRDNGIGFSNDYREKIFEIFQRLSPAEYGGTGIGLALVRKAVQRMRGRVWAQSVPGEGSTFFVSLSLVKTSSAKRPSMTP